MKISILYSILLMPLLWVSLDAPDKVSIDLQPINTVKSKNPVFVVTVKNLSESSFSVLKDRRVDIKWPKITSLGNYIFEIQQFNKDGFEPYTPKADIDPVSSAEEYITVAYKETIIDTIDVIGTYIGLRASPKGKFRTRVSFNSSEWSSSTTNTSGWVTFDVQ